MSDYVYLKNLNGQQIKPVTDLAAINMTTTNGIGVSTVNGGTIGIIDGYIESCYYAEMVDPGVGAANVDSAYIEGGTMFTLIGGYTVSDEIPPASDANPYKIPSELSVRSAIDALATLGPALTPGAGIVVETVPGQTGGTIAVAQGDGINVNTAQQGGVSVKAGDGISVTSAGVSIQPSTGISVSSNGVAVNLSAIDGVVITSGSTIGNDIATVAETLNGAAGSNMVDADNLKGALSVGQAVDVSCKPNIGVGTIQIDGVDVDSNNFLNATAEHPIVWSYTQPTSSYERFGFASSIGIFPKYASGLNYLFIADVAIPETGNTTIFDTYRTPIGEWKGTHQAGWVGRVAFTNRNSALDFVVYVGQGISNVLHIYNVRQYEVTALTDEAIAYIAQLPDPDAFFRSQSFSDISGKYLVKSDMVNPWTYLIGMIANSPAMTVASGLAYQLSLTDGAEHEITVDTFPKDAYGQDSHIQLLLANNSTAVFKSPLNLIDALVPNAANNITVKFRAGQANVYLDDTDAGYVVTVTAGTENGSLYYGLSETDNAYMVFSNITDNQDITIDLTNANAIARMTSVVGNGIDKTKVILRSAIPNSRSMFFVNLSFVNDKPNGYGPTNYLNLFNFNNVYITSLQQFSGHYFFQTHSATYNNCIFDGIEGTSYSNGCVYSTSGFYVTGCTFSNITDLSAVACWAGNNFLIKNSLFDTENRNIHINTATVSVAGCTFKGSIYSTKNESRINISETNSTTSTIQIGRADIVQNSVIDLTGNTNGAVIYRAYPTTASIIGSTINITASTALDSVIGGTATVLYSSALDGEYDENEQPFTKSRTISGGGVNYIMRANGAIGVPVTTTASGQSGSLDTLLADATVEQITFAPVVDVDTGGTISLPENTTISRACMINGAGCAKTAITWDGTLTVDTMFTGHDSYYANPDGGFFNIDFKGSAIKSSKNNRTWRVKNCTFKNRVGGTIGDRNNYICMIGCTISGNTTGSAYGVLCARVGGIYGVGNGMNVNVLKDSIISGNTCTSASNKVNCVQIGSIVNSKIINNVCPTNGFSVCSTLISGSTISGNDKPIYIDQSDSGRHAIIEDNVLEQDINQYTDFTFKGTNIWTGKLTVSNTNGAVLDFADGAVLNLKTNTNENVISGGTVTVPAGATATIIPYGATQASQYVTIEGGANGKTGTYIKNTGENDLA